MIIAFTLFFGAVGYLYYNSKDELSLVERDQSYTPVKKDGDDDLYKDLEDLFI